MLYDWFHSLMIIQECLFHNTEKMTPHMAMSSFCLLPKLPPIQEEEILLLDVASLEDEVEVVYTLYLLHQGREGFVFVLGVADIHLAYALAIYPIKTDFDAAAQHVARGRNLKLTCSLPEVNTLHEDILSLINIRNHLVPSVLLRPFVLRLRLQSIAPSHRLSLNQAIRVEPFCLLQLAVLEVWQLLDGSVRIVSHLGCRNRTLLGMTSRLQTEDVIIQTEFP